MRLTDLLRLAFVSLVGSVANCAIAGGEAARVELKPVPAVQSPIASQAMMLGMAWAGSRVVAVGDHGIVLLSDDNGASFRQAKSVPVSSMLTAVAFADARHGWAVGHWGAVLVTDDGGETWRIQRLATSEDRPLFSVCFFDEKKGVAVGLWSLVLTTDDGGQTWSKRELPPPPGASKADLNLLQVFPDTKGRLFVAAERGFVLRSEDLGATWIYLNTGYKGSFWSGIALSDQVLIVGGQRGTAYRSADAGETWTRIETGSKNSITGFARRGDAVLAVGLDGLLALSGDGGRSFVAAWRPDRLSLTAALSAASGGWINASQRGIFLEGSK